MTAVHYSLLYWLLSLDLGGVMGIFITICYNIKQKLTENVSITMALFALDIAAMTYQCLLSILLI